MIASQRDGFQVLEKDILGLYRRFTSQNVEREFTIGKFSKENVIRKWRPWAFSKKEAGLEFSPGEGHVTAVLVNFKKYVVCF